ncbi:unnamed protein product, partial [Closterium sp. NIES-54]
INKAIYAMYVDAICAEGATYSCVPSAASVGAAALGASESAASLGAIASATTGASESTALAEPCRLSQLTLVRLVASFVIAPQSHHSLHLSQSRWLTPLRSPLSHEPPLSSRVRQSPLALFQVSTSPHSRRTWSILYTLTTASAPVAASGQTLLWHHRLDHPSLPCLRSMHSRLLVSSLPRSLPSLPRSPAPPCLPCVEGRQCTAPNSSSFPPTTAPLQTLHMDVWGPAPVRWSDQESYFLLVVDDYTCYTTVLPLRSKAAVRGVLIPWICATRRQLRERFWRDLPVLCLHSYRGGEFSSGLLAEFCQDEGIVQTFTLLASPQQNGIAERHIGLIMEVARTSMIHAAAPHFLWPFVVRYAAHQLNLWPRVSFPETSPTLRWMGEVGDASAFRDRGALSLVHDTTASKLSPRTLRCVFIGFPTDAPP